MKFMSEEMNVGKTIFWVAIIIGIILAAGVFFMARFQNSQIKIVNVSRDALLNGALFSLEKGDSFVLDSLAFDKKFMLEEIINPNTRLKEGNSIYTIKKNIPFELDVDGDNSTDVIISVLKINKTTADFRLESPIEICVEFWTCSDWSQCINGEKGRVCVDERSCGTVLNKPVLFENC